MKEEICEIFPEFHTVDALWENTEMKNLTLTARGIAIGHANLRRTVGMESDLRG
jgi:hypothetical protein